MVDQLFDVFDLSIYLTGIGASIWLVRTLVDNLCLTKWWRMESWKDRWQRWQRQGIVR